MEKIHEPPDKKKCPTWKERTLMERYLILVCIVFFVAFLIMIGLLIHFQNIYKRGSKEMVCLTPVCKRAAGNILKNLDYSVQPCDDFYNFSCGSYLKYKTIYDNYISAYSDLEGHIKLLTKEVLEKPEDQDEPNFVNKVRRYYQSCLKKSPPVADLLEDFLNFTKFDVWPVSDDFTITFEDTMAKSIVYSTDEGFIFYVYSSYSNGYLEHVGIGPEGTSIREHGLLNTTEEDSIRLKQQYLDLFRYVFAKLEVKDKDAKRFIEEIIELETSLASITEREINKNTTKKTVSELQSDCPQIKWTTLVQNIYNYVDRPGNYSDNLTIEVNDMDYIMEICQFIEDNDKRIIHNLIVWNSFAKYLYRIDFTFSQLVNVLGSDSRLRISLPWNKKLKWKSCINNFEIVYNFGLRYMLLKAGDYEDKIRTMENYVKQIMSESKEIFSKQTWIDDYSKNMTEIMINNMKYGIGYSNISLDENKINAIFDKINVTDSYLHNILQAKKYLFTDFLFNETVHEILFGEEHFSAFTVNAYFRGRILAGKIILPLGIMLPPFYSHGAPNYLNYGGIGRIIGHEISHNFDDLDANQTLEEENNETISWPKEFLEEYTRRKLCLINQYSKFILEGNVTLDGNSSIRDNLADNSGITQAYWAYDKYLKKYGNEPKLPGLDYTNKQMFFIAYAQTKCERMESMKEFYEHSSHSPGRYRVLIPLMNFPEFSKIFNCPLNSYMNPEDKCKLWG